MLMYQQVFLCMTTPPPRLLERQDREVEWFEMRQLRLTPKELQQASSHWLMSIFRLRPGVTERTLRREVLLKLKGNSLQSLLQVSGVGRAHHTNTARTAALRR